MAQDSPIHVTIACTPISEQLQKVAPLFSQHQHHSTQHLPDMGQGQHVTKKDFGVQTDPDTPSQTDTLVGKWAFADHPREGGLYRVKGQAWWRSDGQLQIKLEKSYGEVYFDAGCNINKWSEPAGPNSSDLKEYCWWTVTSSNPFARPSHVHFTAHFKPFDIIDEVTQATVYQAAQTFFHHSRPMAASSVSGRRPPSPQPGQVNDGLGIPTQNT